MSTPQEDYYAVLQVQPEAEPEVIEAAYRQLMRKYHPDSAGIDRERATVLHDRAKRINRAYAVLRDSRQRATYDRARTRWAGSERPPAARPTSNPHSEARQTSVKQGWAERVPTRPTPVTPGPLSRAAPHGPWSTVLGTFSSLYYFLPGPYEWERGRGKDLLATCVLPPLGVAGWSIASGRLNWLIGHAPYAGLFAWVLLAVLVLPVWRTLPRLLLAGAPTALLLTGQVEVLLRLADVPLALAWIAASVLGILFAARLYLFAVLPTLVVCWLLAGVTPGLAAFQSGLAEVYGSVFSTGQLGLLTFACLLGVLTWFTAMTWDLPLVPAQAKSASPRSPGEAAVNDRNCPLFRRISADRVRTIQSVPLRTDRDSRVQPSTLLAAQQEANVLLVKDAWAFLQTDDGHEGWAEWSVASS